MIYFDNAATTPVIGDRQEYYNPSSPHALGIRSERALRKARIAIASMFNSQSSVAPNPTNAVSDGVIFTSGGTESNNIAILGHVLANIRQGTALAAFPYEHPSILAPIAFASERNMARGVSMDNIPHQGNLLVSVSHVNHETGDISDIGALVARVKSANPNAVVLVDGAQGFCKEPISAADMYSFSGHKCHAPTGVGGLWVGKGVKLTPLMYGGGQENDYRPGTENVSTIAQMADTATDLHKNIDSNRMHVAKINTVIASLQGILPDVTVNNLGAQTSPYILNMSFLGTKGEVLVHALSEKGLYVSMGAACRSRKKAVPALSLMGYSSQIAESAIRLSFSHLNTLEEAHTACDLIETEVKRFRKMKG